MNSRRLSSSPLPLHLFSVLVLVGIPLSWSSHDLYENCLYAEFKCGGISVGYPFSGGDRKEGCGRPGLHLDCENGTPTIEIIGIRYQVLHIDPDRQILKIARVDLINNGFCSKQTQDSTLDSNLFEFVNATHYTEAALLYNCPPWMASISGRSTCNATAVNGPSYKDVSVYAVGQYAPQACADSVTVPVLESSLAGISNISLSLLEEALNAGFEVHWKEDREACAKCRQTGGTCGFNASNQTICYCPFPAENWKEARECHPSSQLPPPPALTTAGTQAQGSTFDIYFYIPSVPN